MKIVGKLKDIFDEAQDRYWGALKANSATDFDYYDYDLNDEPESLEKLSGQLAEKFFHKLQDEVYSNKKERDFKSSLYRFHREHQEEMFPFIHYLNVNIQNPLKEVDKTINYLFLDSLIPYEYVGFFSFGCMSQSFGKISLREKSSYHPLLAINNAKTKSLIGIAEYDLGLDQVEAHDSDLESLKRDQKQFRNFVDHFIKTGSLIPLAQFKILVRDEHMENLHKKSVISSIVDKDELHDDEKFSRVNYYASKSFGKLWQEYGSYELSRRIIKCSLCGKYLLKAPARGKNTEGKARYCNSSECLSISKNK